ncbi:hypothetical protein Raf01_33040 [Rugosimonospora africana]|uniref:Uncharacterized protein n=2 Tax=Rugosimonospora africana TaxID=556532 RepID=A0A8J3VQK2_9ACTN|nr:hypothetical protein Raf01_33040 [Rugosimonospora africana]
MGEFRMPDQAVLMVPVHLDALVLTQDRGVVDTLADFTRLPYFDGTRDVHSDVGYLSEAVLASPFANQNLRLPAGVHLHWALPDALTRARSTSDGLTFPAAPNRWLVLRGRDGTGEPFEKAWLVHSDYLHPPGTGAETGSVAYPLDAATAGTSPPYRCLGRVVAFGEQVVDEPGSGWLADLTAVGYGDPLFAAFYPNCRNVFGLYDGDGVAVGPGLRYDVIGWHDDGTRDYLATLLAAAPDEDPRTVLARLAGWAAPPTGQAVPGRLLYYARLAFTDAAAPVAPPESPVTVVLGNTGGQALGAYLADALGQAPASTVEDQLAAVLLAPRVPPSGPDAGARFATAVHESGFVAVPAGPLWTVRRPGGDGTPADATRTDRQNALARQIPEELVPVVDRLNHAVNALNAAQQAYDRATDEIGSLCDQLFADWYRYMLCAYPPAGTGEDYPAIDDVRHFIERRDLTELNGRVASTGVVEPRTDAGGDPYPVAVDTNPNSAASAVARAAADARAALDALNGSPAFTEAGLAYRLQQVEAPRYWEPTEPVVLLAGDGMSATLRHGQDGRLRPDGLLDCQIADSAPLPPQTRDDAATLVRLLDGLAPADGRTRIGFQAWDPGAWDPLLLAWEVEVLPAGPAAAYPADFLRSAYTLAEDEPELHWRDGQGEVRAAATVYSGTSILTPHAQDLYLRRLSGYVMSVYQREQDLPAMSDADAAQYLADDENLRRLLDWQQGKPQPADGGPDPVGTALRALVELRRTPTLAQSLGGFNEALLSRRQTLQLDVADPLGFDDYRRFTDAVRAYVQGGRDAPPYLRGHNRSAPQPGNEFGPLRAGALRLRRLRLLDSYGRVQDPGWSRVLAAKTMPVSGDNDLVTLPPRVVQPARLSFRWLSADVGDQQLTELAAETPLCGWVLANHLDESLMFHGADGAALGALDRNGQWQYAPGTAPTAPEQIPDSHLRQLVTYLRGRGAGFLSALHGALDSALENIDPAGPAGSDGVALLVGRPLAVVRAALNLELRGLPAASQSWADLRADLARTTRATGGFEQVRVPIRVGDYRRLEDGLVGYWREAGDGYQDPFYAPLSEPIDDPAIRTHADGEAPFDLSLTGAPEVLTMLVDPRGAVHATCGVLPVKSIDIPTEQYADALGRIEVTFVAGPLLAPGAVLDLPLPDEPGADWSWVERTTGGWQETRSWPTVDRSAFQDTLARALWQRLLVPEVRWLRPLDADSTRAEVVPPEERAGPPGPYAAAIEPVLTPVGTELTLADFTTAATAAIAAPAWDRLAGPDTGWLAPLGSGDTARVALDAPAAPALPAPLTGMETLIRSTLDICQRRLVPPDSAGTAGPRQLREGWLKLSRLGATT